jgi:hypothetical protein
LPGRLYLDGVSDEHIVVRKPTDVMLVRVPDELPEIQQATRPTLEYYRRHDIIDVLVPVV